MKSEIEHYENRSGGKGTIHIERLLNTEEMGCQVKMYARIVVDVNSSIGYHLHDGDSESYYILQGNALYNDNGIEHELHVGDSTYTPSGEQHAIKNIGDDELIFMALIINEKREA